MAVTAYYSLIAGANTILEEAASLQLKTITQRLQHDAKPVPFCPAEVLDETVLKRLDAQLRAVRRGMVSVKQKLFLLRGSLLQDAAAAMKVAAESMPSLRGTLGSLFAKAKATVLTSARRSGVEEGLLPFRLQVIQLVEQECANSNVEGAAEYFERLRAAISMEGA
jgi:hypothetical protein